MPILTQLAESLTIWSDIWYFKNNLIWYLIWNQISFSFFWYLRWKLYWLIDGLIVDRGLRCCCQNWYFKIKTSNNPLNWRMEMRKRVFQTKRGQGFPPPLKTYQTKNRKLKTYQTKRGLHWFPPPPADWMKSSSAGSVFHEINVGKLQQKMFHWKWKFYPFF